MRKKSGEDLKDTHRTKGFAGMKTRINFDEQKFEYVRQPFYLEQIQCRALVTQIVDVP